MYVLQVIILQLSFFIPSIASGLMLLEASAANSLKYRIICLGLSVFYIVISSGIFFIVGDILRSAEWTF